MAVRLFYKHYPCNTSADTLFILHGLFGMLDNWHNSAKKLSEHINVISVDARNHGHSPHTDEMSYKDMAEDLADLMEHLNISKAMVLGHSMGGKTAMTFANVYPHLVSKLIIVDVAPTAYKPGHLTYFDAYKTIPFSKLENRKEADEALSKYESNTQIRMFLLKNISKQDSGYSLKINVKAIEDFYPELIGEISFEWLINCPTLFIKGGKSNYISAHDHIKIEEVFTDVSFSEIDGAGHWVHAEKQTEFLQSVLDFLV